MNTTIFRTLFMIALVSCIPALARAEEPPPSAELPPLPEASPSPPPVDPEPDVEPPRAAPIEPLPPLAPEKPQPRPGFGKRASFVLALENVVGFAREKFSGDGIPSSTDHDGFFPGSFGPRVGFHGVHRASGFTYGLGLGLTFSANDPGDARSEKAVIASVLPRFGFVVSTKGPIAFWARVGPSLRLIVPTDGYDPIGLLGVGGELYAVVTLTEHTAVTFGPTFDAGLLGSVNGIDTRLTIIGLELGLLADF